MLRFIATSLLLGSLLFTVSGCSNDSGVKADPIPRLEPLSYPSGAIVADHRVAYLSSTSQENLDSARSKLHIAYGHTSHGSQIVNAMNDLVSFAGDAYRLGENGLDLRDTPFSGASDLGSPDRTAWVEATRNYLNDYPEVNVVLWSWCGQVSSASELDIQGYLDSMNALEVDYPGVAFVYMTGHLDGTGSQGNLHLRNEQIRNYAISNGKALYDFADIESFDPDGNAYLELGANDNCDYEGGNWCLEWQAAHPEDWFETSAAHSQPLNGNRKAYAAWYLFSRLGM